MEIDSDKILEIIDVDAICDYLDGMVLDNNVQHRFMSLIDSDILMDETINYILPDITDKVTINKVLGAIKNLEDNNEIIFVKPKLLIQEVAAKYFKEHIDSITIEDLERIINNKRL